ncbi:uncharacterized protein DS421_9g264040 [Arachis hypogaea]|nr:uncharacterized protein DS421_9g264040 [Arachis hypogaea]
MHSLPLHSGLSHSLSQQCTADAAAASPSHRRPCLSLPHVSFSLKTRIEVQPRAQKAPESPAVTTTRLSLSHSFLSRIATQSPESPGGDKSARRRRLPLHGPPSRPWLSLPHVSLSLTAAKAARRARLSSLRSVADNGEVLLFSAGKVLVW